MFSLARMQKARFRAVENLNFSHSPTIVQSARTHLPRQVIDGKSIDHGKEDLHRIFRWP